MGALSWCKIHEFSLQSWGRFPWIALSSSFFNNTKCQNNYPIVPFTKQKVDEHTKVGLAYTLANTILDSASLLAVLATHTKRVKLINKVKRAQFANCYLRISPCILPILKQFIIKCSSRKNNWRSLRSDRWCGYWSKNPLELEPQSKAIGDLYSKEKNILYLVFSKPGENF